MPTLTPELREKIRDTLNRLSPEAQEAERQQAHAAAEHELERQLAPVVGRRLRGQPLQRFEPDERGLTAAASVVKASRGLYRNESIGAVLERMNADIEHYERAAQALESDEGQAGRIFEKVRGLPVPERARFMQALRNAGRWSSGHVEDPQTGERLKPHAKARGFLGALAEDWNRGTRDIEQAIESVADAVGMAGSQEAKDWRLFEHQLRGTRQASDPTAYKGTSFGASMSQAWQGFVRMAPSLAATAVTGGVGGMAAKGIGLGAKGATLAQAAAQGAKALNLGGKLGQTAFWGAREAGPLFDELRAGGLDDDSAALIALPAGLLSGMVEMIAPDIRYFTGGVRQEAKRAASFAVRQEFLRVIRERGIQTVKDFSKEMLEEVLQGGLNVAAKALANKLPEGTDFDIQREMQAQIDQLREAGLTVGMMQILGGGVQLATNNLRGQDAAPGAPVIDGLPDITSAPEDSAGGPGADIEDQIVQTLEEAKKAPAVDEFARDVATLPEVEEDAELTAPGEGVPDEFVMAARGANIAPGTPAFQKLEGARFYGVTVKPSKYGHSYAEIDRAGNVVIGLGPHAQGEGDVVADEEVRHAADMLAAKDRWIAANPDAKRPFRMADFDAEKRQALDELRVSTEALRETNPQQFETITRAIQQSYEAYHKEPMFYGFVNGPTFWEDVTKFAVHQPRFLAELTRQLSQLKAGGTITEATPLWTAVKRIAEMVRQAVVKLTEMLQALPRLSPKLAQQVDEMTALAAEMERIGGESKPVDQLAEAVSAPRRSAGFTVEKSARSVKVNIDGYEAGEATFVIDTADRMASSAARRIFPVVGEKDAVYRQRTILLPEAARGKGLGKWLLLKGYSLAPKAWHYNSQASSDAHRTLQRLADAGLIEFHKAGQAPVTEDAGAHVVRITPAGVEWINEHPSPPPAQDVLRSPSRYAGLKQSIAEPRGRRVDPADMARGERRLAPVPDDDVIQAMWDGWSTTAKRQAVLGAAEEAIQALWADVPPKLRQEAVDIVAEARVRSAQRGKQKGDSKLKKRAEALTNDLLNANESGAHHQYTRLNDIGSMISWAAALSIDASAINDRYMGDPFVQMFSAVGGRDSLGGRRVWDRMLRALSLADPGTADINVADADWRALDGIRLAADRYSAELDEAQHAVVAEAAGELVKLAAAWNNTANERAKLRRIEGNVERNVSASVRDELHRAFVAATTTKTRPDVLQAPRRIVPGDYEDIKLGLHAGRQITLDEYGRRQEPAGERQQPISIGDLPLRQAVEAGRVAVEMAIEATPPRGMFRRLADQWLRRFDSSGKQQRINEMRDALDTVAAGVGDNSENRAAFNALRAWHALYANGHSSIGRSLLRFAMGDDASKHAAFIQRWNNKVRERLAFDGASWAALHAPRRIVPGDDQIDPDAAKPADAEPARRIDKARGFKESVLQRWAANAKALAYSFTHAFAYIPNTAVFSSVRDWFVRLGTVPDTAKDMASESVGRILHHVGPNGFKLLEAHSLAANLLASVDRGEPLRFGFQDRAQVATWLASLQALAAQYPSVQQAIQTRKNEVQALVLKLVNGGFLPNTILQTGDWETYFHQQVLLYQQAKAYSDNADGGWLAAKPVKRAFQKARTTGVIEMSEDFDYNTSFVEAEVRWMYDANVELEKAERLKELMATEDITAKVQRLARQRGYGPNDDIADLIRQDFPGYVIWSPLAGSLFYESFGLPQQVAEALERVGIDQMRLTDRELANMIHALNKRRWIIRSEVAKQLDNTKKAHDGPIASTITGAVAAWKAWTLFAPHRVVAYTLRNMTGDIDSILAAGINIIGSDFRKELADAHRETVRFMRADDGQQPFAISPTMQKARRLGLINSTILNEVARPQDVKQLRRLFADNEFIGTKAWRAAWEGLVMPTEYFNTVSRVALWNYYRKQLSAGTLKHYGGARRRVVDTLMREQGADVAAAHLARNAVGDYGDITLAGQWLRKWGVAPFWSWLEINVKRVPLVLGNAARSGNLSLTGSVMVASAFAKVGAMYGALWLWNNLVHPDEERDLDKYSRQTAHLIMGRNADGSVNVFRNIGSLGDFGEWFGINELTNLMPLVKSGQVGAGDAILEALGQGLQKKLSGAAGPMLRLPTEILAGISFFPDPTEPRSTAQGWESVARTLGLGETYRELHGWFQKNGSRSRANAFSIPALLGFAVVRERDAALTDTYDLRERFLESKGKDTPASLHRRNEPQANMRWAIMAGDKEAFKEAATAWIAGIKKQEKETDAEHQARIAQSFSQMVARIDPLSGSIDKLDAEFTAWLTTDQRRRLDIARSWALELQPVMLEWFEEAKPQEARLALRSAVSRAARSRPERQEGETREKYQERLAEWDERRREAANLLKPLDSKQLASLLREAMKAQGLSVTPDTLNPRVQALARAIRAN